MYWDTSESGNYVTLYLNSNTGTTTTLKNRHGKWCTAARKPTDTSWGSAVNVASTKILTSGMGLWLKRYNYEKPITVTMAGSVVVSPEGRTHTFGVAGLALRRRRA